MLRFWRKKKNEPRLPELLGVTIDRAVTVDSVSIKLLPEDSLIEIPQQTFSIVAQGHCDLGEQSHLHRFYPDDDSILLQMQGGDGIEDQRIDEIMLWSYYDVKYPGSDHLWKAIQQSIRQRTYMLNGPNCEVFYERAWFGDSDQPEEPIQYWEKVSENQTDKEPRRIFQTAMLFARELSDGKDEMLLVNMEEVEGTGERSVAYMLGRSLSQHELQT
ncbi:DUF2491 family protein [Pseudovibrio ascidiaceicola]|uniref:DUF2491 family protein n=1 Tax=Pseudovibrio ascidiaceicola TaxID=285279 RepID=UPI003D367418